MNSNENVTKYKIYLYNSNIFKPWMDLQKFIETRERFSIILILIRNYSYKIPLLCYIYTIHKIIS